MTQKKYEFTGETTLRNGRTLYRIRRISDGQIGGWIQSEKNLSHEGTCWVSGDAQVYGNSWIFGDARVFGNAYVFDSARVYGNAHVFDNARVYGNAYVFDSARVYGNAYVYGNARVSGDAAVSGDAVVTKAVEFLRLTRDAITVTDKHIAIGCEMYLISDWLKSGFIQKIGKKHGYSKEDIKLYTRAIKLAATLRGIK